MKKYVANKGRRRAMAATLLYIEAAGVFSLGAFLIVKSFTSTPEAPGALIGEVIFALLGGSGLIAAARGFQINRNYGRAPAVLANLIALGIAYFQISAHLWIVAIPLALIAAITLVCAISIIPD
jgi:hypothetical protein